MTRIDKVLVIGGGIGGLSAAIVFASQGKKVELLEKRRDFNVPGVGLGQPACALRVYRRLGVLEEILDTGFCYDHMSTFDPNRVLIAEHRFQMGGNGLPAFCALPRADLHRILCRRAETLGVEFHMGAEVVSFGGEHGTEISFSDGTFGEYDLVAAFDGIRSTARRYIVGDLFGPRPCGIGAWRVQVDRPRYVTGMEFLQGIRGKAGAIPIGRDKMYLFNIRPENPSEHFPADAMHLLLKERLEQFGSYVMDIAKSLTPKSPIVYGALEPFIVPYPWHRGRVVMGGDAAHVVPPHLTAGAAMAVEDAYVLAQFVASDSGSIHDRLRAYAETRFARNAFVYTFACEWMNIEQSVRSEADLAAARIEYSKNLDGRISTADRILDSFTC
ncbi:FAD-dependent monooxygenase [uncultured Pigmentiphaga sp.]|uniref:FAD-dependent monooxygenase n=1 Tax=uncultured Pigmentiphaga sp. TaxID=340361 RepID=UPI002605302C|nr:FAD-dependent monooxygenase [uncultured Pigmentiphaga sp.]